ncbi:unnamed protein product [Cercopithifilaria johnstoni]|uniref:Uncharacterized protein n=1 Tax=Cercopithifilaria johnstoni TaxID=2874296 RepID=A0A8J2M742_9BILA|nr:unnamed protein product [Cercopithifilaria johnstoni]
MCSRFPTYCGHNLCCCTSNSCYNQLRNHFLRITSQLRKAISCDIYRQQWIGNSHLKRLNKSSYPTSEEMYRRTDCTACISRVDEEGVEMSCTEENVDIACRGMDLRVGGFVLCNGYGDCCCQGDGCPEALRNFYSGSQKLLGTPQTNKRLNSAHYFNPNALIIITFVFITILLLL